MQIIRPPDSWPPSLHHTFKALAILSCVVIVWQSLAAGVPSLDVKNIDKLQHFVVYGFLAGLIRLGWWQVWGGFIVIICATLGFGLEFLQGAIAQGRTASLADGVANISGALVALLIIQRLWRS